MPKILTFVSCPMCGIRKPLVKKGTNAALGGRLLDKGFKGITHMNVVNLDTHRVAQFCECLGNRKHGPRGFPIVGGKTLCELVGDPQLGFLVDEIYEQAASIVKEVDDARARRSSDE